MEAVGADTPCSGYILLGVASDQHRFNRRRELCLETTASSRMTFHKMGINAKVKLQQLVKEKGVERVLVPWQSPLEAFRKTWECGSGI